MGSTGKSREDVAPLPTAPELLTLVEAATYLRIARQTLYNMVNKRAIPFLRAGRQLRFRRSDLDRWLTEQAVA